MPDPDNGAFMGEEASIFDEMTGLSGALRKPYESYRDWFDGEDLRDLRRKSSEAELFFRRTVDRVWWCQLLRLEMDKATKCCWTGG